MLKTRILSKAQGFLRRCLLSARHKEIIITKAREKIALERDIYLRDSQKIQNAGLKIATYDSLIQHKSSHRLYILGSGESINSLTDKDWHSIGKHDSIGFNWFFASDFIPTYYHMECTPSNLEVAHKAYSLLPKEYETVPFLVNLYCFGNNAKYEDYLFGKNPQITIPRHFHVDEKLLGEILSYYQSNPSSIRDNFYLHYRGSLSILVSLGLLLGYQEIVLVGIDLGNTEYFFFDKERYPSVRAKLIRENKQHNLLHQKQTGELNSVHRTFDRDRLPGYLTIDRVLAALHNSIAIPRSTLITIKSRESALYPLFPLSAD